MTITQTGRRHRLRSALGAFEARVDESGARIASITSGGTEFLLQIDGRDAEPASPPAADDSSRRWHERYAGGWHVLLPHAGDARTVDGIDHAFHGEAAWRPWRTVELSAASATLEIDLDSVPLRLRRRVTVTETGIRVHQRVRNLGKRATSFSWTEHPAFGAALLDPTTQVTIGDELLDIRFPEAGGRHGAFRSMPLRGRGTATLAAPVWTATLRWDPALFPHLHIWQEHRQTTGFPWWGDVSTIALEPASREYDETGGSLGPLILTAGADLAAEFALDILPTHRSRGSQT